jgi:hypothetical protein
MWQPVAMTASDISLRFRDLAVLTLRGLDRSPADCSVRVDLLPRRAPSVATSVFDALFDHPATKAMLTEASVAFQSRCVRAAHPGQSCLTWRRTAWAPTLRAPRKNC